MIKKILILSLFYYLLTLLQTSFFPHFFSSFANFVLIAVFFINLFTPHYQWQSQLISASIGGFFLDIFSESFIGYYLLISLSISFFIHFIFKKHIQPTILLKYKR